LKSVQGFGKLTFCKTQALHKERDPMPRKKTPAIAAKDLVLVVRSGALGQIQFDVTVGTTAIHVSTDRRGARSALRGVAMALQAYESAGLL
jgi:hypothetical protein